MSHPTANWHGVILRPLMIVAAKMRRGDTAYRFQMGELIQGD